MCRVGTTSSSCRSAQIRGALRRRPNGDNSLGLLRYPFQGVVTIYGMEISHFPRENYLKFVMIFLLLVNILYILFNTSWLMNTSRYFKGIYLFDILLFRQTKGRALGAGSLGGLGLWNRWALAAFKPHLPIKMI